MRYWFRRLNPTRYLEFSILINAINYYPMQSISRCSLRPSAINVSPLNGGNLNRVLPSKSNQSTMGIHKIILPLALTMLIAAQLGTEATVEEERLGTPVLERAGATPPVHGTYYRLRNWWTLSVRLFSPPPSPIYCVCLSSFLNVTYLHSMIS